MSPYLPPHLIERNGIKICSTCRLAFSTDSKPSISKAFAAHIRAKHPLIVPITPK